ncbi:hypothetical protein BDW74DRAFT_92225 [Aspergillus multicolor]|uniref:uncharacterized protein n=1 Tax=Aspergillus multicolor TaxID=41759 RepID=UPI003CCE317A
MGRQTSHDLARLRADVDRLSQQQAMSNARHTKSDRQHAETARKLAESNRRHAESERMHAETDQQHATARAILDEHTRLFQADSERWMDVRHRTFLCWVREKTDTIPLQKEQIAGLNILIHRAVIAADTRMFAIKGHQGPKRVCAVRESLFLPWFCSAPSRNRSLGLCAQGLR